MMAKKTAEWKTLDSFKQKKLHVEFLSPSGFEFNLK